MEILTRIRNLTWKLIVSILALFSTLFCIVSISVFVAVWLASKDPGSLLASHPKDKQLIQNYTHNKIVFNELANMLQSETELLVIFPDEMKCQIANQRLISSKDNPKCAQYVQMFKDLGLMWAYSGEEPLWLPISASGLSVSGSSKGYIYSTQVPSEGLVEDTDKASGRNLYRHIEGNWYIFYESY